LDAIIIGCYFFFEQAKMELIRIKGEAHLAQGVQKRTTQSLYKSGHCCHRKQKQTDQNKNRRKTTNLP